MKIISVSCSSPEVDTDDPEYTDVMKKITEMVGVPKNYGLSPEEQEEEDRREEEERKQKVATEAAEKKRRNEATLAEMAAQYEEWVSGGETNREAVLQDTITDGTDCCASS